MAGSGYWRIEMKGLPESINEEIKRALKMEEIEGGF